VIFFDLFDFIFQNQMLLFTNLKFLLFGLQLRLYYW